MARDEYGRAGESKEYTKICYMTPQEAYRSGYDSDEAREYRESKNMSEKCMAAISAALIKNYEGYRLRENMEDEILEDYGIDRVRFVLASVLSNSKGDRRYSEENMRWGEKIRKSESAEVTRTILPSAPPALVDVFIDRVRAKEAAREETELERRIERERREGEKIPETRVYGTCTKVMMPWDALVKAYPKTVTFFMPKRGPYAGLRFSVDATMAERIPYTDESGRERREYMVTLIDDATYKVKYRSDTRYLTGAEIAAQLEGTKEGDFRVVWTKVHIPEEAVDMRVGRVMKIIMPDNGRYAGKTALLPTCFYLPTESTEREEVFSIPDDTEIHIADNSHTTRYRDIPAGEFIDEIKRGVYARSVDFWTGFSLPEAARICVFERKSLVRFPEGDMGGYCLYLPNSYITQADKGMLNVAFPAGGKVEAVNSREGKSVYVDAECLKKYLGSATAASFSPLRRERDGKFAERIAFTDANIPAEMKGMDIWVSARRYTARDGKAFYRFISPVTGKVTDGRREESTDYDTARAFASDGGDTCLAAVIRGEGMGCLVRPAGKTGTPFSYTERTAEGGGVQTFFLSDDLGLRPVSGDGREELYMTCGIVPVTGDRTGDCVALSALPGEERERIGCAFGKRHGAGPMTREDRDTVRYAMSSEKGETFTALYDGENARGPGVQSDMSLMMRLSCLTLGDGDAMERIYSASPRGRRAGTEEIERLSARAVAATRPYVERERGRMREDTAVSRGERAAPNGKTGRGQMER